MNYLVVLSGVPGSGKSYFSNALREDKEKHVYIISSDQIRKEICGNQQDLSQDPLVWKIFYSLIKTYSEDKEGIVILDATNAKKEYRLDLIKPYRELYDEIDLVCFHIDKDLVLKQNKEREFPIPECALLKLIDAFEMPDKEEEEFFDHIDLITDHNIDKIIKRY